MNRTLFYAAAELDTCSGTLRHVAFWRLCHRTIGLGASYPTSFGKILSGKIIDPKVAWRLRLRFFGYVKKSSLEGRTTYKFHLKSCHGMPPSDHWLGGVLRMKKNHACFGVQLQMVRFERAQLLLG